jgi:hypothetical protein
METQSQAGLDGILRGEELQDSLFKHHPQS